MARKKAKEPAGRGKPAAKRGEKAPAEKPPKARSDAGIPRPPLAQPRRNGGWREIEALREKRALRASLADVWDEDFDLDDEILAELDHTAEFFTTEESEEEAVFDDEGDIDEFFEDEEV